MDDFEWHETKNRANVVKHGIGFADAMTIWRGLVLDIRRDREDEARWLSFCVLDGAIIAVAWTRRGDTRRLISARLARRGRERKDYEAFVVRTAYREPD